MAPPQSLPTPNTPITTTTATNSITDPARNDLQSMLNANAYRIADLLSQLEESHAQLKRLRARALKASGNDRSSGTRRRSSPCINITHTTKSSSDNTRNRNANNNHNISSQKIASSAAATCLLTSPVSVLPPSGKTMVLARGHWSADEAKRFEEAVQVYGPTSYSDITRAVGTRTEKQVRDHAWRVRQKKGKAAQFAALNIPPTTTTTHPSTTFMLGKTMVSKLEKKPDEPDKKRMEKVSAPRAIMQDNNMVDEKVQDSAEEIYNNNNNCNMSDIDLIQRPSSPFSAVSTDGTCSPSSPARTSNIRYELGELDLLCSSEYNNYNTTTTPHDNNNNLLIVDALFADRGINCNNNNMNEDYGNNNMKSDGFDWNCHPNTMEVFGDDYFLLPLEQV